ncbi:MAG: magnesium transporter, partial [Terriglobales bacterium]
MPTVTLSEVLGSPVFDPGGRCGRVRELAVSPQEDPARIAILVVRTKSGDRALPFSSVTSINGGLSAATSASTWTIADESEGLLLLSRDLLDQQIIDVHGRKVVRVNDVDLHQDTSSSHPTLKVAAVDVGA